jgi:TPR repeat protein
MKNSTILAALAGFASMAILAAPVRAEVDDGLKHYNEPAYAALARHLTPQAEAGNGAAQLTLAVMYESGWGVPQDANTALRYYRLAAAQGSAEARSAMERIDSRRSVVATPNPRAQ